MSQPFDTGKTLQAWQRFVSMGELVPYVPAPVARSWFRCKKRSQLPVQLLPSQLPVGPEELEDRALALGRAFQQTFPSLLPYLSGEELLLALVDSRGSLVEWQGNHRFLVSGLLEPGMVFQEEILGTMAVSLALKEQETFFVRGAEHYYSCYHQIASFAAPIMEGTDCIGILGGWTALGSAGLAAVAVSLGKQVLEGRIA
ncbi:MAG: hypothetical protein GX750_03690 [Clostridia bacterium]|nr:hypothetical protein [Clostridia bacterium]